MPLDTWWGRFAISPFLIFPPREGRSTDVHFCSPYSPLLSPTLEKMDWSIWWVNMGRILSLLNSAHPPFLWELVVSRLSASPGLGACPSAICAWVGRSCLTVGFFNWFTWLTDRRSQLPTQTLTAVRVLLCFSLSSFVLYLDLFRIWAAKRDAMY